MHARGWVVGVVGVVGLALAGAALGCTPVDRERARARADADVVRVDPPRLQPTVITILQTRDHEVTVYAADHELRFTVAASGGVVLATMLREEEFRASFPGLHERYDRAFAGEHLWLDASAEPPRGLVPSSPAP